MLLACRPLFLTLTHTKMWQLSVIFRQLLVVTLVIRISTRTCNVYCSFSFGLFLLPVRDNVWCSRGSIKDHGVMWYYVGSFGRPYGSVRLIIDTASIRKRKGNKYASFSSPGRTNIRIAMFFPNMCFLYVSLLCSWSIFVSIRCDSSRIIFYSDRPPTSWTIKQRLFL